MPHPKGETQLLSSNRCSSQYLSNLRNLQLHCRRRLPHRIASSSHHCNCLRRRSSWSPSLTWTTRPNCLSKCKRKMWSSSSSSSSSSNSNSNCSSRERSNSSTNNSSLGRNKSVSSSRRRRRPKRKSNWSCVGRNSQLWSRNWPKRSKLEWKPSRSFWRSRRQWKRRRGSSWTPPLKWKCKRKTSRSSSNSRIIRKSSTSRSGRARTRAVVRLRGPRRWALKWPSRSTWSKRVRQRRRMRTRSSHSMRSRRIFW